MGENDVRRPSAWLTPPRSLLAEDDPHVRKADPWSNPFVYFLSDMNPDLALGTSVPLKLDVHGILRLTLRRRNDCNVHAGDTVFGSPTLSN